MRRNTHKRWPDGGEVFDASIEVPVTIRDPDRPIGTHVFTAMARDGAALRWTAVTIDEGDDAKDALDRITIPQDVLASLAPTAVPRSSIIVSDEPLSKETNYRTEFVAVLSNQPQGGFITRKVTPPDDRIANGWGDDGFPFFGRSWNSGNTPARRLSSGTTGLVAVRRAAQPRRVGKARQQPRQRHLQPRAQCRVALMPPRPVTALFARFNDRNGQTPSALPPAPAAPCSRHLGRPYSGSTAIHDGDNFNENYWHRAARQPAHAQRGQRGGLGLGS